MEQCFRCGIMFEFDSARFRPGAPCVDCLDWVYEDWRLFPRGEASVQQRLDRWEEVKRLTRQGMSQVKIAEALGISKKAVHNWQHWTPPAKWNQPTEDEIDRMFELRFDKKMSITEVAEATGWSRNCVWERTRGAA